MYCLLPETDAAFGLEREAVYSANIRTGGWNQLIRMTKRLLRRPRRNHQILVIVVCPDIAHVKSGYDEEIFQCTCGEIGAVLVIDIPEGDILENPAHVGHLEEHGGVQTLTDGTAHHAHEAQGIRDVFERHLAYNEVGLSMRVPLGVEVLDELDCVTTLFRLPLRHECWIKTYASISAHGTEHR